MFSTARVDSIGISLWKTTSSPFIDKHLLRAAYFLSSGRVFSTAIVDVGEVKLWKSIATICCIKR
jgi:hypothetical protein